MGISTSQAPLFAVNLINDRRKSLVRRRALQRLSAVGSVAMLAAAAVLGALVVTHVTVALRMRSGIQATAAQLKEEERICKDLDRLRETAVAQTRQIAPLIPFARARVAWAPKVTALADALPAGTGIVSVQGSQGDLFSALNVAPGAPPGAPTEAPQMSVAILYAPSAGSEENPIAFLDHLRKSAPFMQKFSFVRLEATEQETWQNQPVVILHSFARGGAPQ